MCDIRGKPGDLRVIINALPLPMCCTPGKAANPRQAAVPTLPPSINIGSASRRGVAFCAEHPPPGTMSGSDLLRGLMETGDEPPKCQ